MGIFEDSKRELQSALYEIRSGREQLNKWFVGEQARISRETSLQKMQIEEQTKSLAFYRESLDKLARERQIGFPWLAKAYKELEEIVDNKTIHYLKHKKNPGHTSAAIVANYAQQKRALSEKLKIAEYQIQYYESIAPFLLDLKEEVDIPFDVEQFQGYTEEELKDPTTRFLSIEDYKRLSVVQRNQLALDRYWGKYLSKQEIGKAYERYVGYLYETDGYDVQFKGIQEGFSDLGIDLVCTKGKEKIFIQCKNWSKYKEIRENAVFQFFGTLYKHRNDNKKFDVKGKFYTTTELSPIARSFANELGFELIENHKFEKSYPCIKCNVGRDGSKIYHLPFDQQYDNIKIEPHKGELYCATIAEAEQKGFRRAFRWYGAGG